MKRIITSVLSLAFLSGIFVNSSFGDEIQPAEVNQEKASNMCDPESHQDSNTVISDKSNENKTAPMGTINQPANLNKNNVNKKSSREKYINKIEENEKRYSDSVNKEIEKVKNMSEKEFKKYLSKSYLILYGTLYGPRCLAFGFSFFFNLFSKKLGSSINKIFLKIFSYGFKKGFDREENKQNIKKDLNISDYDRLLTSDIKKGIRAFLINFHPDVISKNVKDSTFFDKIHPELEALYSELNYFCQNDVERSCPEISGAIGKE